VIGNSNNTSHFNENIKEYKTQNLMAKKIIFYGCRFFMVLAAVVTSKPHFMKGSIINKRQHWLLFGGFKNTSHFFENIQLYKTQVPYPQHSIFCVSYESAH